MALFRATTHIDAAPERVWALLVDWESSPEWMVDATRVEVGEPREGVGARIRAVTDISGIPLVDDMVVTRWVPRRLIEVSHVGRAIRGIGWFELAPDGRGTRFEWGEEVDPPIGPLGELGARILRRHFERGFRRSLVNLRERAESGA